MPRPPSCPLHIQMPSPTRGHSGLLYLENGVHSGQLAVHGDAENFRHQMCAQKVGDSLVDMEVTGAYPDFGQKPVIFCIRREKNGVLISWDLVELIGERKYTAVSHTRL